MPLEGGRGYNINIDTCCAVIIVENNELTYSDNSLKTYQVLDTSQKRLLENRLMERLRNSKNIGVLLW